MKFDVISYKFKNGKRSPIIVHNIEGLEYEKAVKKMEWMKDRTPDIGIIEVIEHISLSEGECYPERPEPE